MPAHLRSTLVLGLAMAFLGTTSCSSCRRSREETAPRTDETLLPLPPTPSLPEVTHRPERGQPQLAAPSSCSFTDEVEVFEVKASSLQVLAPPGASDEFAIGHEPPTDLGAVVVRGIVNMTPDVAVRDLPWFELSKPPLPAHDGKGWVFAFAAPARDSAFQVVVAREGRAFEQVALGDGLAAVDLACDAGVCAVLMTRVTAVQSPGATLVMGAQVDRVGSWNRFDLDTPSGDEHPVMIAGLSGAERTAWVVLASPTRTSFVSVGQEGSKRIMAWSARFGVVHASRLRGEALVVEHGAEVNDRGCALNGAVLSIRKGNAEPRNLPVTAPPNRLRLVPMPRGALLVWVAPVNCLTPDRQIVYALTLDEAGAPVGSVMPVGDATDFAARPREDGTEMFLVTTDGVKRVRFKCATS